MTDGKRHQLTLALGAAAAAMQTLVVVDNRLFGAGCEDDATLAPHLSKAESELDVLCQRLREMLGVDR